MCGKNCINAFKFKKLFLRKSKLYIILGIALFANNYPDLQSDWK